MDRAVVLQRILELAGKAGLDVTVDLENQRITLKGGALECESPNGTVSDTTIKVGGVEVGHLLTKLTVEVTGGGGVWRATMQICPWTAK